MFNDDSGDSGLYLVGSASEPQVSAVPAAPVQSAATPDAFNAVTQSLELLSGDPSPLLSADPAQSKLAFGWAVVGVCAVAVMWAASLDKGAKK